MPIRYFLTLLWAHPILHISRIRVKQYNWCMRGGVLHVSSMKTDNCECEHNAARYVQFQDKNKEALWVARKDVGLLDPCALCSNVENQSPLLLSAALATILATYPLNHFSMYLSNFNYHGDGRQQVRRKRRDILHGARTQKSVTWAAPAVTLTTYTAELVSSYK